MTTRSLPFLIVSVAVASLTAEAADWPQWRGPQRDGLSQEKGLLGEWPKDGPKLLWQVNEIGSGYSTPAVVGDRLYLLSNEGLDNEFVRALDAKDGSEVWSVRLGRVGNPKQQPPYPGARSTPTVVGKSLYAIGSDGDLVCLNIADGKMLWKKSLRTDFGGQPGVWAYSESPLVDGDVVVCTPGGSAATLVALNAKTGDLVWKSPVQGGDQAGYSSAIIVEVDGVKQYVQFLAKGLVGVEAKTGKFLWRYGKTAQGSPANIPSPLARNNLVYCASGRGGCGLVKLDVTGGTVKAEEVYFSKKLPNGIGGAVQIGKYLYGATRQGMVCAEFETGKVMWQDRSIGAGSVLLRRLPPLYARRKRKNRAGRGHTRGLSRARPLHATGPAESRPITGMGVPGRFQWPTLYPRHGHAVVLRHQKSLIRIARPLRRKLATCVCARR